MICTVCGLFVAYTLMQAHMVACNEQAARQAQLNETYYGYPKADVDLLEALIRIADTNPESIEHGYNRKES